MNCAAKSVYGKNPDAIRSRRHGHETIWFEGLKFCTRFRNLTKIEIPSKIPEIANMNNR